MGKGCKYIKHKGHVIEVARLTGGIQEMLKDVRKKMYSFTRGKPVGFSVPWHYVDNFSSTAQGLSWMDGCETPVITVCIVNLHLE